MNVHKGSVTISVPCKSSGIGVEEKSQSSGVNRARLQRIVDDSLCDLEQGSEWVCVSASTSAKWV